MNSTGGFLPRIAIKKFGKISEFANCEVFFWEIQAKPFDFWWMYAPYQ
tara:strand:- start:9445 stop:9588 length:144 start_codon:yes stop_codon:yes gene_type:complete